MCIRDSTRGAHRGRRAHRRGARRPHAREPVSGAERAPRADTALAASGAGGVWQARYFWVTLGAVAMIFLAATQALAVTTVMPLVATDLGGDALYAVAFAGTLATSVIGMVAVGAWCDRREAVLPLHGLPAAAVSYTHLTLPTIYSV